MGRNDLQGEASGVSALNRMRSRAVLILALFLAALAGPRQPTRAQDARPTEYQLKAAFLFNFAKFVEWPDSAFPAPTAPFVIGVLGNNPFRDDLARTVRDKTIDAHPLLVQEYRSAARATNCHLLFISNSERKSIPDIIQGLRGRSILTVSEVDHFTEAGGMINFVLQGTKIRFQINKEAAVSAGLKISSKLMSLAVPTGG